MTPFDLAFSGEAVRAMLGAASRERRKAEVSRDAKP